MPNNEIIHKIESKRAELIKIALKDGLSSSTAICHSQELDILLNEYNRKAIIRVKPHYRKKGK